MRLFIIIIFLLSFSCAFAQRQNVYFYKDNGKRVPIRDSADYIRIVQEPDAGSMLYNVKDYYPNGNVKLVGKSSTVDPVKFEGQRTMYYPDGKTKSLNLFKAGVMTGEQSVFYSNGKLQETRVYAESPKASNQALPETNYLIKSYFDSTGTALVTDGNGHYRNLHKNGTVAEEGDVKNGKRQGTWKGYDKAVKVHYQEVYTDGQLSSGYSLSTKGDTVYFKNSRSVQPQFTGGIKQFYKYLSNTIKYPGQSKYNKVQGRVLISFIVEKDGSLTGLKVLTPVAPDLDAEALRVVSQSPKWIPGTMYGRNVRVSYTVPIVFALGY